MATEKKTAPKGEKEKSAVKATAAKKTTKSDSAATASPAITSSHKAAEDQTGLDHRKVAVGTVVSDKMQKTIVVKVDRRVRHSLYKKYVTRSRRFKAHDEKNEAKIGDLVTIVESRPLSRDKRWALQKIVRRAEVTLDANV